MSDNRDPSGDPSTDAIRSELIGLFFRAFSVTVDAVRAELASGRRPSGRAGEPSLSLRENGMPSLSNGSLFEKRGPLQYADLLEQQVDPSRPHYRPKFAEGRFEEVDALVRFVRANPGCSPVFISVPAGETASQFDILRVQIELQLAHAANAYFRRYGDVAVDARRRSALLRPFIHGLFAERVRIANVIPIALVHFSFDRVRLTDDAYVIRMSERLQRARWSGKAYAASGHDAVLAAATHAFVLTGWHWPNASWVQMTHNLAAHNPELRDQIEQLFAALRLVTGVSTGYAQELRVARGWTHLHMDGLPEVHAAGARRYPEDFDDFGWMRADLPVVGSEQMVEVGRALRQIRSSSSERLALALRRLNAAMIRTEVSDTILDATIALEILLGDGDAQSIAYKLRLRAGALARLKGSAFKDGPAAVSRSIREIYEARSRIVHGARKSRKTREDRAGADRHALIQALATLRSVLRTLLDHPRYLDPLVIDAELLLKAKDPAD